MKNGAVHDLVLNISFVKTCKYMEKQLDIVEKYSINSPKKVNIR